MAKKEEYPGVVYRLVTNNEKGMYGVLVAVHSPDPEETVRKYARHCAVDMRDEPKLIEGMDPAAKGIDVRIRHQEADPGFAPMNKLKMTWWDKVLTD